MMAEITDANISNLLDTELRETLVDVHRAQASLQSEHVRMTQLVVEIGSLLARTFGVHGGSRAILPPLLPATAMAACGGCWGVPLLSCHDDNSTTATLSSGSGFFSPCGNSKDAATEAALSCHAPPPAVHEFTLGWQQGGSALLGGSRGGCRSGGDGIASQASKLIGHSATQLPLLQQRPRPVLSLASELGITSPRQSTTASARSSSPTSTSGSWEGSADSKEVDAYVFVLPLRVAEGMQLGMCASRQAGYLCLDRVLPRGDVEAWNRQCGSSGAAEKVMQPGDRIVSVNEVAGDPAAMLAECDSKRLLRFCVVRNGP